jgi:hypothetical protein
MPKKKRRAIPTRNSGVVPWLSPSAILGMVLRETLLLTFAGMAIGIPSALAASRFGQ